MISETKMVGVLGRDKRWRKKFFWKKKWENSIMQIYFERLGERQEKKC